MDNWKIGDRALFFEARASRNHGNPPYPDDTDLAEAFRKFKDKVVEVIGVLETDLIRVQVVDNPSYAESVYPWRLKKLCCNRRKREAQV